MNIVEIARMPENERKSEMMDLFKNLMSKNDAEMLSSMKDLITEMCRDANENEYINLCLTNMSIVLSMDDRSLKSFIKIRMKANSELNDSYKSRDMEMIEKAMERLPENDRKRLMAAMGQ
ncbi:dehydrogenase [Picrophilus oshimae]|uniref:Uncharacterized protein n=2 Tax=Picrophilus torridus (strain ATCC 700027 / DSM 9790 / JCM 10055 / NBRC 100828 / KAW 2/3) TaxID=1122961 RepID=A0A8G2FVS1_PICTO|nr:dehydrogenase [Picrophilus oshimae]SMD30356.1 hypothetical protein SAMN02745355_0234 [Picrophilus oshimae DSM 9789]